MVFICYSSYIYNIKIEGDDLIVFMIMRRYNSLHNIYYRTTI